VTYQNGAPAHSIGVPTPPRVAIVVPTPPRVVIVVPIPPRVVIVVPARGSTSSSSRYRGANRGFSRLGWSAEPTLLSLSWHKPRGGGLLASLSLAQTGGSSTSKTARNLADVARRTVRLPRVVIRGRPAACSELACCGRPRPRVVIVVPTPPRVVIVVPTPPRVVIVVPIPPRVVVVVPTPPRVTIVVQTGGETLGGKWLCVFLSIL